MVVVVPNGSSRVEVEACWWSRSRGRSRAATADAAAAGATDAAAADKEQTYDLCPSSLSLAG
jgi:hypothetical protein